jgi:hypothetical protein
VPESVPRHSVKAGCFRLPSSGSEGCLRSLNRLHKLTAD